MLEINEKHGHGATAQVSQAPVAFDRQLVTNTLAAVPRAPVDDSQGRANIGEDSVPVAPKEVAQSLTPRDDGAGAPGPTESEALTFYEGIVEKNFLRENRLAEALAEIHRRRLYKLTHASFGDYVNKRWQFSRSRAYQLLRFVQRRKLALSTGELAPANERQARRLDANGTGLQENSGARRMALVTIYLQTAFAKSPPEERRKFIADVRTALDGLEAQLDGQHRPGSQDPALAELESTTRAATADASLGSPGPAHGPLATPFGPTQAAGAVGFGAAASRDDGTQAHLQAGGGATQNRPAPATNTGPVFGCTMAEARKRGYCR